MTPVQQVRAAAHELENVCRAMVCPPVLARTPLLDLPDDMRALIDRLRDVPLAPRFPNDGKHV